MLPDSHLSALRKLYIRIGNRKIDWALTGSTSFALQGIPIKVNDIDVQTNKKGAYEIQGLFSEYVTQKVSFSSTDAIKSHFGKLCIDGVEVEIMGDIQKKLENGEWEPPVDVTRYRKFVNIKGMKIPVLSLEYEYQAYVKLGRIEKAEMLRRYGKF
jgi:hypothetical protein